MKKSFLIILALGAAVAFSSCAKKCVCVYSEDGKKYFQHTNTDVKHFTKDTCDNDKDLNWKRKDVQSQVNNTNKVDAEQVCKLQ